MDEQITTAEVKETCKCCDGTGVQYDNVTGLKVKCPCCGGTGKWNRPTVTW